MDGIIQSWSYCSKTRPCAHFKCTKVNSSLSFFAMIICFPHDLKSHKIKLF